MYLEDERILSKKINIEKRKNNSKKKHQILNIKYDSRGLLIYLSFFKVCGVFNDFSFHSYI